jgi:SAM-dependent methyltransferase
MDKPFSEACERNKAPILAELQQRWGPVQRVFELGSGTGQHALHFAAAMPGWHWQGSELAAQLPSLRQVLAQALLPNLPPPLAGDVNQPLPLAGCDAVFTANTLHIMGWHEVQRLFEALGRHLPPGALVSIYGPFHYGGRPTSEGNARFDAALRAGDARRGVRDFEAVDALARGAALELRADSAMPANNRCLTWQREALR